MFEPVLAKADGRVAQLPRERKTFGAPPQAGKTYLSEKSEQVHDQAKNLENGGSKTIKY